MIQTDRLIIRPLKFIDEHFIVELLNEKDFIENIGDKKVRNTDDARRYMENGPLACQQQHGFSLMTVTLQNGEPIGLCGLLKRDELTYPDLGYAFLSRYYRQGYGFEAATGVLSHFHRIRPILAMTSKGNNPSQQLLIKLGFNEYEDPGNQTKNNTASFIFNGT
jgi:RimJ/RimL family protein N-acetyltransferase